MKGSVFIFRSWYQIVQVAFVADRLCSMIQVNFPQHVLSLPINEAVNEAVNEASMLTIQS